MHFKIIIAIIGMSLIGFLLSLLFRVFIIDFLKVKIESVKLLIFIMIMIFGTCCGGYCGSLCHELPEYTTTDKIVLVNDNNNIKGNLFLGSGYIGNEFVYSVYKIIGDNTFIHQNLNADKTQVVMDLTGNFSYLITRYNGVGWDNSLYHVSSYELHVPKGTIVKSFNLDGV